ncbi:MAG: PQQ-dependent sugar dehydrogenase [Opitutales bacterium]
MKQLLPSPLRWLFYISSCVIAQTASGEVQRLYAQHCLACHGQDLDGGLGGSLLDRDDWKQVGPELSFIDYEANQWVYLAYAASSGVRGGRPVGMTRIVRGRIIDNSWMDEEVIFEAPTGTHTSSGVHFGSRMAFQ